MIDRRTWASGWRGAVLVAAGVVLGATIIQPAVAHVSDSVRHLTRQHLDDRYINTNEGAGGDLSGPHGNLQIDPGTVTGAEVNEGTLGQVPSAAQADDATDAQNAIDAANVDGSSIATFSYNYSAVSSEQIMFPLGGLSLTAACVSGPALRVEARTDTNNSYFRSSVGNSDPDFDIADNDMLVFQANTSDQNGTIVYRQGSSSGLDAGVVAVTFGYETNPPTGNDCQLTGVAVGH